MKGITKATKQAINRSLRCKTCPNDYRNCTPAISRACSDSFKDGFKKGVAWLQKQMKEEQQ